jgi:hypothetical protein
MTARRSRIAAKIDAEREPDSISYMSDMSHLSQETPIDLEQLRERLRKMSDSELRRFGRAALDVCEPHREVFVIQLEEARAEWKRRKQKKPL